MKITVNKPAADVYLSRHRFVQFVFTETDVYLTSRDFADPDGVAVQPRATGGVGLEVTGDLKDRIIRILKPIAGKPFYTLHPKDAVGIRLISVAERPARHVPAVRIWTDSDIADTEPGLAEQPRGISPDNLWTIYITTRDLTHTPTTGRPSKEFIAARTLMAMFKRIAQDIGEGPMDLKPITEAIELLTRYRMGSRLPRRFHHDSAAVQDAVWKAEHLDNPTLNDQLDTLVTIARLVQPE
jgi:hypothetical protein